MNYFTANKSYEVPIALALMLVALCGFVWLSPALTLMVAATALVALGFLGIIRTASSHEGSGANDATKPSYKVMDIDDSNVEHAETEQEERQELRYAILVPVALLFTILPLFIVIWIISQ